jgi:hypothetical protein
VGRFSTRIDGLKVSMNEILARSQIKIEEGCNDWEVWTPTGWFFTGLGHVSVCHSLAEAKKMLAAPIDPCDLDCDCWLEGCFSEENTET